MRDDVREKLSAMADGELRSHEMRSLAHRLGEEPEAAAQLERYFLMRETLREALRPHAGPPGDDLAARLRAALEDEPVHMTGRTRRRRLVEGVARPVAGVAIAASVALAMVTLWPRLSESPNPTSAPTLEQLASGSLEAGAPVSGSGSGLSPVAAVGSAEQRQDGTDPEASRQWQQLDPAAQERLNFYLVNHSEHSSTGRLGGMLKYARIAGHDRSE
ncbi:sigma-E factor negative regulatory protein [Sediminicurvatus halobius]|nr:RseA family anti-sigma factor [Spiribacter halobius]UEX76239.1 sigma-E factor negative regulatory protein [Spiribacter halobius]